MSLLKTLTPTKELKTWSINAYQEDIELFSKALEFLQSQHKGSGKFTEQALFEHLTSTLREDAELTNFISGRIKKRSRVTQKKQLSEEVSL